MSSGGGSGRPVGPVGEIALDEAEAHREVERESVQRVRQVLPLLALVHVVLVLVFRFGDVGDPADPATAPWREQLVLAHLLATVVSTTLAVMSARAPRSIAARAQPMVAVYYLMHGAWVASIDQLVTPAMTPYVIVCIGVALVITWSPVMAAGGYLAGFAVFAVLGWETQPDAARRVSLLVNGLTIAALGFGLSVHISRTTIRRIRQNALIDAQHRALTHLASRDALTDLPNRRVFARALTEAVQAARDARAATVALLDLDHFKDINDVHGHEVGDTVLVAVATLLRDHLRTDDVAARLGGEEFGLLLSGTAPDQAEPLLEGIREQISELRIGIDGIRVTTSIGFGEVRAEDDDAGQAALRRADEALYAAKDAGRDRAQRARTT